MRFGLEDLLVIVKGDIADKEMLDKRNIDTIVNAANSTLMGSNQGVDGAIHRKISNLNQKILLELGGKDGRESRKLRCPSGKAVVTSGYDLCKYIIHVVGAKYDGAGELWLDCSSSRIYALESCYFEIVDQIRKKPEIRNVAIPVISSGDYGFPFETAVEVAIAGICNAIIDWKNREPESFELSALETIYLFIYHNAPAKQEEYFQCAWKVMQGYLPVLRRGRRVVFQKSMKAHMRYLKEIKEYDENRGYFFCAKTVRILLMVIRLAFLPGMFLKDLFGKRDWVRRRQFVEIFTMCKMALPLLFLLLGAWNWQPWLTPWVIGYNLCGTVTYLMVLIIMPDIQRPSANLIRSIIMLFINYMEVSLDMAVLYIWYYKGQISVWEAAAFGLLGNQAQTGTLAAGSADYIFMFADSGIKFFFLTVVFGYFSSHMRQRRFKS